jgi:hypothetical protein
MDISKVTRVVSGEVVFAERCKNCNKIKGKHTPKGEKK